MLLNLDVLDDRTMYFKPKRNDRNLVSIYSKPGKFYTHKDYDIIICLTSEVYHVGCYGNLQKNKGVSTCHAYLVGVEMTADIIENKTRYEPIFYDPKTATIAAVNGPLNAGDICLITRDNKVYRLDSID